jgi:phenol hydroxylase P2 protein
MSNVFIAFQRNEETRPIVEAILADNPLAVASEQPAMVKIDAPGEMTIKRATIEEKLGRAFDLQEMQIFLITLSGNIDETDDEFNLRWKQ